MKTPNKNDAERAARRGDRVLGPWIFTKRDTAVKPLHGAVAYVDQWWAVTPDGEILFYWSYGSPQCNVQRGIVDLMVKNKLYADFNLRAEKIPLVFIPKSE